MNDNNLKSIQNGIFKNLNNLEKIETNLFDFLW